MISLDSIPSAPGVYIYKNSDNKIIYIGKAVNLKKRVTQYFKSDEALGYKTRKLLSQIASIDYQVVSSEIEALILESSLIKQYRPKFNSQLKDDKSYIYITISKDKIPLIKAAFKSNLNSNCYFYGPFPDSSAVKSLLKTIKSIFPFYSKPHPPKKCLYCHLNLCPGPNPDPKEYRKNINKIKHILNGNFSKLISKLNKEMLFFSKSQNFEMAKLRRDQISSVKYITSGWKNLSHLYQKIELQEDQIGKALRDLKTLLTVYFPDIKNISRFEAYDISNLASKYFVGAMTVFSKNKIDSSHYRHFKIYSKETPDDQLMIKEVLYRRLKHPEWPFPDFILVDGGKPQVSAANSIILDIPIIGLAKKEEIIVIKKGDLWHEIKLAKNSPALNLLQQLRDEAHRFANNYRKKLIQKNTN